MRRTPGPVAGSAGGPSVIWPFETKPSLLASASVRSTAPTTFRGRPPPPVAAVVWTVPSGKRKPPAWLRIWPAVVRLPLRRSVSAFERAPSVYPLPATKSGSASTSAVGLPATTLNVPMASEP